MPVALAGVAVIFAALIALLIYYGAEALGKVIKSWTPDIHFPYIGSLKTIVSGVVDAGVDFVRTIMLPIVHPLVQLLHVLAGWIARIIGGLVSLAELAAVRVVQLVLHVIPAMIARLIGYTVALVAAARAELFAALRALRADVRGWLRDLRGWVRVLVAAAVTALVARVHALRLAVHAWLDDLRSWVVQRIAAAVAALSADLDKLRGWTAQRIAGVESDLSAAVRAVEGDIAAAAADVTHTVEVDLVRPLEGAWQGMAADVAALEGVIATDFPDLSSLLRDLDLSKLIDLLGVSGLSLVMSRVLARYLRECGVPTCRNTAGWAKDLQDLLSLIGDAGLLAFFVAMVTDPKGTASEVDDVLGGLARPFVGSVRDLLGV